MIAVLMTIMMIISMMPTIFADPVPDYLIDNTRTGSIEIYKYDYTKASADQNTLIQQILDDYVSTGQMDSTVINALGGQTIINELGNGERAYGYAIKGVQYKYLKVADIVQYSAVEADGITRTSKILYKFRDSDSAAFLAELGLSNANAFNVSSSFAEAGYHYFESETLINALEGKITANATGFRSNMVDYMNSNANTQTFAATDSNGHTVQRGLPLGLYIVVESSVPEMVYSGTDPFFVSIPMTSVNGGLNNSIHNGGEEWQYDVTVYPKNLTDNPTLEKTVRELKADTGKNNGTALINDGYAHNATGSDGDIMEYQIISKLPNITDKATYLTEYTFLDTLSAGLQYAEPTVTGYEKSTKIEWFSDAACTNKVATWTENDTTKKFTVSFANNQMTIQMTAAGLAEINPAHASQYMRITYAAKIKSNADVVYGDDSNPNIVSLRWKRTNQSYYDMLADDCHVYTYALDLTKQFSDNRGNFANVNFKLFNETDNYWVVANKASDGVYYVTGHVAGTQANADGSAGTTLVPNSRTGVLKIFGLEDDAYVLTETQTDDTYSLLASPVNITIVAADNPTRPCVIDDFDVESYSHNSTLQNLIHLDSIADGTTVTYRNNELVGTALAFQNRSSAMQVDLPYTGTQYLMITMDVYTEANETANGVGLAVRGLTNGNPVNALSVMNYTQDQTHILHMFVQPQDLTGLEFVSNTGDNNVWHIKNLSLFALPEYKMTQSHNYLTASAIIDGSEVAMTENGSSAHAVVPLVVLNNHISVIPLTGERGTWMLSIIGIAGMALVAVIVLLVLKKKRKDEDEDEENEDI